MLTVKGNLIQVGTFSATKRLSANDWRVAVVCPACCRAHTLGLLNSALEQGIYACPNTRVPIPIALQLSATEWRIIRKHRRRTGMMTTAQPHQASSTAPGITRQAIAPRKAAKTVCAAAFVAEAQRREAASWDAALANTSPTQREAIQQQLRQLKLLTNTVSGVWEQRLVVTRRNQSDVPPSK